MIDNEKRWLWYGQIEEIPAHKVKKWGIDFGGFWGGFTFTHEVK